MSRLLSRFAAARPPVWFLLLAALVLANLLRQWQAPILDRHEFRQTQTALSAQAMRTEGWSLAYPLPLFGPPWSAPMEFPLYQGFVAGVSRLTDCSIESAGRSVSIFAFFAALPALAGLLASAGFPPRARWIAIAAVMLTPVYLFYSRTVLIESTALALALWFLHAYVRGLDTRGWCWPLAAAAFGMLGAMVKITTFAPFCIPAAVWTVVALWRSRRLAEPTALPLPLLLLRATLPAIAAAGAAWWWVKFGDGVKAANPLATHLQSTGLRAWNLGTLAQRLDPTRWHTFALEVAYTTCGPLPGLIALATAFVTPRRYLIGALAALAAFFVGPLCFFNLYLVHDYYFYANAVCLTLAAGLLFAGLWENPRIPRPVALAVALIAAGVQLWGFNGGLGIYLRNQPPEPPVLATAIRTVVPSDGVVLIAGRGWNPEIPFYAQRRAITTPDGFINDIDALATVVGRLPGGSVCAFVWQGDGALPLELQNFLFEELGFSSTPIVADAANTLFLRPELSDAVHALLNTRAGSSLTLAPPSPVVAPPLADFKISPAPLGNDNPICHPSPASGRSLYGISVAQNAGRACIVAHAPSRLVVNPPAGATTITVSFGMADECLQPAYQGDGVVVSIFASKPGHPRRVLFRRSLDPVVNPADRGIQTAQVPLPPDVAPPLVFEASVGVANDLRFDWFYWYEITVK